MLKIGIIGCGKIAQVRHIPEYLANENCRIIALYDLNQERARELAAKLGAKACSAPEELFALKPDAVSVCTANTCHASDTVKALEAGCHVLCEKPMAVSLDECEAMVKTAAASGRVLMIDQNQRLAAAHVKAKELLDAGVIGRVLTFKTVFGHGGPETWSVDSGANTWFFDAKKAVMGAMADLGVHKTDLIEYLLGAKVKRVSAALGTLDKRDSMGNPISVDDNAVCIYEMDNGCFGTMTASWTFYDREDNSTVIYGSKGTLRIYEDPAYPVRVGLKSGEVQLYQVGAIQTNDHQTSTGIIDAFADAIVNRHKPLIDGADVLHAMKAVFAAIESAKTGRRIEIK